HGLGLGGLAQACGFLGLDLGLDPQALGLLPGAGGLAAACLQQQVGALALEAGDLATRQLGAGGDLGRLHPPLRHPQRTRALARARRRQRLHRLAGLQPFQRGQAVGRGIGIDRHQALVQQRRLGIFRGPRLRRGQQHEHEQQRGHGTGGHGASSMPRLRRSSAIWARRCSSSAMATASRLRAWATPARAAARWAMSRASDSLRSASADWAMASRLCARASSSAAYCSASASEARASACRAALMSSVGGGSEAQAVSASTHPQANACSAVLKCAKLDAIGGPWHFRMRGHCRQPSPDAQRSGRLIGDWYMDIGYFLKLMTEKNASDMFLTTGAPVYIKVEGKLYPLGNTGLPTGMVKKI